MRRRCFTVGLAYLLLISVATAAHSGTVNPTELATCAVIAAADARLVCFDSLAAKYAGDSPGTAAAGNADGRSVAASGTPATAATMASQATPGGAAAQADLGGKAVAGRPDNFAENDPKNFGFTRAQLHEVAPGPSAIQARIVNTYQDQPGHTVIVLDLGQTWVCTDEDGRLSAGDQVTIKRGAMASYSMLTAAHHIYKVHRVR